MADGLLASVVRAWDTTGLIDGVKKRIVVAIAMNTAMWRQPITARQIRVLEEEWGVDANETEGVGLGGEMSWFEVLRPVEKELACGDVGDGAMRDWREIVEVIEERLGAQRGSERSGERTSREESMLIWGDDFSENVIKFIWG